MGWQTRVVQDPQRSLIVVLIAALWIGVGIFTVFTVFDVISDDAPRTASSSPSAATPTEAGSAQGAGAADPALTTAAGPGSTSRPAPALPDEGPGVSSPGVLLIVTPSRGGAFDVWERVRLPDPVDTVTLSPPDVAGAGSQFEAAEPVVTMVQLSVDGQPIPVPDGVVDGPYDVPVEAQITEFDLSYQLDGTSVRSLPSTARRALAAVSPLLDDTPYNLPVSVIVNGPVLGVDCPLLDLSDRACGRGTQERMQVSPNLPFDDAVVTIQFDLPG